MRRVWKKLVGIMVSASMVVSMSMPSFAFYQEPASKKGILISSQDQNMLNDIVNLGCKQVVCNLASYQNVNSFDPLASMCRSNGIAWHAYPVHFFTKPEFLDDDGISFDLNTPRDEVPLAKKKAWYTYQVLE